VAAFGFEFGGLEEFGVASILSIGFDDQNERDALMLIGCSSLSELLSDFVGFAQTLG